MGALCKAHAPATTQSETMETGPLPQFYADRFGWDEEVDAVVKAYRTLTPAEQQRVCIFGKDYGEAGAIDLLGPRKQPGLPPAISGQNSYWMWGTHGCDANIVIAVVGDSREQLQTKYREAELSAASATRMRCPSSGAGEYGCCAGGLRAHRSIGPTSGQLLDAKRLRAPGSVSLRGMSGAKKPKLGQNFLVDENACVRIADALGDARERTVVEIGPGHGAITGLLAARVARLHCIEFDPALARELEFRFRNDAKVHDPSRGCVDR